MPLKPTGLRSNFGIVGSDEVAKPSIRGDSLLNLGGKDEGIPFDTPAHFPLPRSGLGNCVRSLQPSVLLLRYGFGFLLAVLRLERSAA